MFPKHSKLLVHADIYQRTAIQHVEKLQEVWLPFGKHSNLLFNLRGNFVEGCSSCPQDP